MGFVKYQHIERFNTDEVDGIEVGECYVFGKIDGSAATLWLEDGKLHAGSRNRELTIEKDNQGFFAYSLKNENFLAFFKKYPELRLFLEWLVPHSLKTYTDDSWRKAYVYDVMNKDGNYLHYNEYKPLLEEFNLLYIPPLRIIKNGNIEVFTKCLDENKFLIEDGKGTGEGVVIKRYNFKNKYGRTTWAKIVTNEFKQKHIKEMGAPSVEIISIESRIADKYITKSFVEKELAKIKTSNGGSWSSKLIPKLLGMVFHEFITEESWNFIKEFKNPKIDFRLLNNMAIAKTKEHLPEIF